MIGTYNHVAEFCTSSLVLSLKFNLDHIYWCFNFRDKTSFIHIFDLVINVSNDSLIYKIVSTSEVHSGYEFQWSPLRAIPFSVTATYHNHHHTENDGNYAQFFVVWDFIMNTNRKFLKNKVFVKSVD